MSPLKAESFLWLPCGMLACEIQGAHFIKLHQQSSTEKAQERPLLPLRESVETTKQHAFQISKKKKKKEQAGIHLFKIQPMFLISSLFS